MIARLLIFISILSQIGYSQEESNKYDLVEVNIPFTQNNPLRIRLPSGCTIHKDWYGEGLLMDFRWPDQSHIMVHWGGLMTIPFLRTKAYRIEAEEKINSKTTRKGTILHQKKRLYWREENLGIINIYYSHISATDTAKFDYILDDFIQLNKL